MRAAIALITILIAATLPSNARERHRAPEPAPAAALEKPVADLCHRGAWSDATPDIVLQASKLLEQYGAAKSQLAALDTVGSDSVVVYRTDAKDAYLVKEKPAYQGTWTEVRSALQDMLNRRLAALSCKLQALGVSVSEQKIGAL